MSTNTETFTATGLATSEQATLRNVGIEFEFPIAQNASNLPATVGEISSSLRDELRGDAESNDRYRNPWLDDTFGERGGYIGSDHVGAEITSGVLNILSDEPEAWYNMTIDKVWEEYGRRFAQSGTGATNFGLHLHLSDVPDNVPSEINDKCCNEHWTKVFFCSSVKSNNVCPWRFGGTRPYPEGGAVIHGRSGNERGSDHYEFRLPEPMAPEHFTLVMDFLRDIEHHGIEHALENAKELVYNRDERLTPVQQYETLKERHDDWPTESALKNTHVSEHIKDNGYWFRDLMEGEL